MVSRKPHILFKFPLWTEARARIHEVGGGDKMVKVGSAIELNCTVESGDRVHASMAVFWYLDGAVLDWMGQTGPGRGVQVVEERGRALTSLLRIQRARVGHGGRYTCGPTTGVAENVTVHIIAGYTNKTITKG